MKDEEYLDIKTESYLKESETVAQIVNIIVNRRKELGITQRKLAEMCEISKSSVTRIESFETIPNLDTLLRIFQALKLRIVIMRGN
jgi:predicted transcriptional regulator